MNFARKFRKLCRVQGWTQRSLAEKLGTVSPSTISNWSQGVFLPRVDEAAKLAEVLGVSVQFLIRDDLEEDAGDGLSVAERQILDAARIVGHETALRRIMAADRVPAFAHYNAMTEYVESDQAEAPAQPQPDDKPRIVAMQDTTEALRREIREKTKPKRKEKK